MLGLTWSDDLGLRFGRDLVFTYGPWGWLTAPVALDVPSVLLSGLFACGVVSALWCSLGRSRGTARETLAWQGLATVLAPALLALTGASWTLVVALFALALRHLVARRPIPGPLLGLLVACGALLTMVKFSDGVLWEAANGAAADLVPWVSGSLEQTAGYAAAMYSGPVGDPLVVLAGCLTLVSIWSVQMQARGSLRHGWPAPVAVCALLVFALKQGFTREDTDHVVVFVSALLVVARTASVDRDQRLVARVLLAVALVALVVCARLPSTRLPQQGWGAAVRFVTDSNARELSLSGARSVMRERYAVPSEMIDAVGSRPVAIDPVEVGVAWAYGMSWHPVPDPQPYAAYTPVLDRRNAKGLLGSPRQAVLRTAGTVDDRLQLWDSPAYTLALLCTFREAAHDAHWTLLLRDRPHCGPARPAAAAPSPVRPGDPVPLPGTARDELLTMRFVPAERSPLDAVSTSLFKDPDPLRVRVDGSWRRLPRPLAGGPLIVRLPRSLSWAQDPVSATGDVLVFNTAGTVEFSVRSVRIGS